MKPGLKFNKSTLIDDFLSCFPPKIQNKTNSTKQINPACPTTQTTLNIHTRIQTSVLKYNNNKKKSQSWSVKKSKSLSGRNHFSVISLLHLLWGEKSQAQKVPLKVWKERWSDQFNSYQGKYICNLLSQKSCKKQPHQTDRLSHASSLQLWSYFVLHSDWMLLGRIFCLPF